METDLRTAFDRKSYPNLLPYRLLSRSDGHSPCLLRQIEGNLWLDNNYVRFLDPNHRTEPDSCLVRIESRLAPGVCDSHSPGRILN